MRWVVQRKKGKVEIIASEGFFNILGAGRSRSGGIPF